MSLRVRVSIPNRDWEKLQPLNECDFFPELFQSLIGIGKSCNTQESGGKAAGHRRTFQSLIGIGKSCNPIHRNQHLPADSFNP